LISPSWVSAVTPSSRPILHDPAVDHLQHGGAGEVHPAAGRGRQAAGQEVAEGRPGMGAAALPLADDLIALGDQVGRAPEVQVGEGGPEIAHEGLDVVAAAAGLVQRVLQQHVRCGDLVDDREIGVPAPELGEPAADDGLVVRFRAHRDGSFCSDHRNRSMTRAKDGSRRRRPNSGCCRAIGGATHGSAETVIVAPS